MKGVQSKRFYPESVPGFPHEPSRDRFEIRAISDDCGEGVVALRPFRKGETVFAFTGYYSGEITLFSLQVKPGLYLHDPFFMGKILHRCDPNCDVDMERRLFVARRDIEPGQWVTMNYEQTEDRLFRPFTCNCGDNPCQGFAHHRVIRGRKVNGTPHPVPPVTEPVGQPEPVMTRSTAVRFKLAAAQKQVARRKAASRRRLATSAAK